MALRLSFFSLCLCFFVIIICTTLFQIIDEINDTDVLVLIITNNIVCYTSDDVDDEKTWKLQNY